MAPNNERRARVERNVLGVTAASLFMDAAGLITVASENTHGHEGTHLAGLAILGVGLAGSCFSWYKLKDLNRQLK